MPWAHYSYHRIINYYPSILEKITDIKHLNMDLLMMETLVRAEVSKRDFTKRQLKIIGLIFTFSFGYGKEWGLIPKMMDFELAGISKIKIRNELNQLIKMGVVEWKQEENLFRINDPRKWTGIPYHSTYNDERAKELFFLNLQHSGIDVSSILDEFKKGE